MAVVDVKEIIGAGVHFGHRASRWHPKMAPFIFGKRNLIHIIDVRETLKGIVRASNFLSQIAYINRSESHFYLEKKIEEPKSLGTKSYQVINEKNI